MGALWTKGGTIIFFQKVSKFESDDVGLTVTPRLFDGGVWPAHWE